VTPRINNMTAGCKGTEAVPEPTVAAGIAGGLMELAVSRGASRGALAERSLIDPAELQDLDNRIPFAKYVALMRAGKELCHDPALGSFNGVRMRKSIALIALTFALGIGTPAKLHPQPQEAQAKVGTASDSDAWRHYLIHVATLGLTPPPPPPARLLADTHLTRLSTSVGPCESRVHDLQSSFRLVKSRFVDANRKSSLVLQVTG
jgi:hypothetical protein